MRSVHATRVKAPSSSLLRFLRLQTDNICFFSPNKTITPSPRSCPQSSVRSFPPRWRAVQAPARWLSTVPRRQAMVESSLLDLDFMRHEPRHHLLRHPPSWPTLTTSGRVTGQFSPEHRSFKRYRSSDNRPLLERLWHPRRKRPEGDLKPDDLPPLPGLLGDAGETTLGRSVVKASNELKLRCTEFDGNGNVTLVNGEFKKAALIARVR